MNTDTAIDVNAKAIAANLEALHLILEEAAKLPVVQWSTFPSVRRTKEGPRLLLLRTTVRRCGFWTELLELHRKLPIVSEEALVEALACQKRRNRVGERFVESEQEVLRLCLAPSFEGNFHRLLRHLSYLAKDFPAERLRARWVPPSLTGAVIARAAIRVNSTSAFAERRLKKPAFETCSLALIIALFAIKEIVAAVFWKSSLTA